MKRKQKKRAVYQRTTGFSIGATGAANATGAASPLLFTDRPGHPALDRDREIALAMIEAGVELLKGEL